MNTLDLKEAVKEIALACRRACERKKPKPFVFIVGAGTSYPPVLLASDIEAQCREEVVRMEMKTSPPDDSAMSRYSHWFSKAYPQPLERQEYLRSLIEGKPISAATFRLAHLLIMGSVANTVVTPNFDDFLTRALTIFGQTRFRVCDHPQTVERIDPESTEIQIIHVHGTHWFYDLTNLRPELEARAQASPSSAFTMVSLLDRIFANRSPIIVGYSGWDGDVIMTALRRRLARGLPYNMYFFCYRRNSVDSLPEWLKSHPDVRFVVPLEPEPSRSATAVDAGRLLIPEIGIEEAARAPEKAGLEPISKEKTEEPVLPAQQLFDELIRELRLDPPQLISNPLEFFANQIQASIPGESDPYSLRSVVARIGRARDYDRREQLRVSITEDRMEAIRDAVRRSLYKEAILKASELDLHDLNPIQLLELRDLLWLATQSLDTDPERALLGADVVISISNSLPASITGQAEVMLRALFTKAMALDQLQRHEEEVEVYDQIVKRLADSSGLESRELVASALVNKGITLGQLQRSEEAVALYDEVVRRYGDSSEPALQEQVSKALFNKGVRLGRLQRSEEEVRVYDEVVRRYGDSPDTVLQERVAKALVNKGITLAKLQRSEEEVVVYDEVVRRYGDSPDPTLQERVANALLNKGITLDQLQRSEEAVSVYGEEVRRYGDSPAPALQELVAKALFNKGVTLGRLQRSEEELAVYDEVVRCYGDSPNLALQEQVAKALVYKGMTLGQLKRSEEAVSVYDELVRRYGESSNPALQAQVAKALFNKGVGLGQLKRSEEEVRVYDELVRRYRDSPDAVLQERVAKALLNKGVTLGQLQRSEEAVSVYDELVKRYRESSNPALQEVVTKALANKDIELNKPQRGEGGSSL